MERIALLAAAVRTAIGAGPALTTPDRVAAAITPFLGAADLLAPRDRHPDDMRYRQQALYFDPACAFSIVALIWLPGQSTRIHDHVGWCTVGVVEGVERETSFDVTPQGGEHFSVRERSTRDYVAGTCVALAPGTDVHRVFNPGPALAISLHVYGADLRTIGSSIQRCYDDIAPVSDWML